MLFNLPPTEQYSRVGGLPFFAKFGQSMMSPGGWVHSTMVNAVTKNKE